MRFRFFQSTKRSLIRRNFSSNPREITLIKGDGIGPEVTNAVVSVFSALRVPVIWDTVDTLSPFIAPDVKDRGSAALHTSLQRTGVALKGPLYTPLLEGFPSPDVQLAKRYGVFAHVVPIKLMEGIEGRNVDIVVVRENTEGAYSGLEHEVKPGVVQALNVVTEEASRRIAEFGFKYAKKHNRTKISVVHKANIMKMADGLFLDCCRKVREKYPELEYEEVIVDNCAMQLVKNPQQFDVIITTNFYGNVISEAAAGLIGGAALTPGCNYGEALNLYEQGARHIGMNIAGRNLANPTSYFLASVIMLRDIGLGGYADVLEEAVKKTVKEGNVRTRDLGGQSSTTDVTEEVIRNLF